MSYMEVSSLGHTHAQNLKYQISVLYIDSQTFRDKKEGSKIFWRG